eukprot:TRINITY_DN12653_c0_g1_i1.p1 TRINITY_DN12653_c0_g1~~TRINITY_DN12653_c0_g1_i1.p1  ORF type:complete len:499 (+),score=112.41 TRINITY_DN12653_c0_g1_i1:44-1498(+)
MGNSVPKEALAKFEEFELENIEQRFDALSDKKGRMGEWYISKDAFLKGFFPEHPDLSVRLFRVFDSDRDGKINYQEFCLGLAMCCRGFSDEKLRFVFKMFDVDRSGMVTKNEMISMLAHSFFAADAMISASSGSEPRPKQDIDDVAKKIVDDAFKQCDKNHDGKLSYKEFMNWASTSDQVRLLLDNFESMLNPHANAIQGPTDVQHNMHVGYNANNGVFEVENIPNEWKKMFQQAGIKKSELRDPETAKLLMGMIVQHAGEPAPPPPPPPLYMAIYPYVAARADELALEAGDKVEVLDKNDDGWWVVKNVSTQESGLAPHNYLAEVPNAPPPPVAAPSVGATVTTQMAALDTGDALKAPETAAPAAPVMPPAAPKDTLAPKKVSPLGDTSDLLAQIRRGAPLEKPKVPEEAKKNDFRSNLLSSIKTNRLRPAAQHVQIKENLNEKENTSLCGLLAQAMDRRRTAMGTQSQQGAEVDDWSDSDWA